MSYKLCIVTTLTTETLDEIQQRLKLSNSDHVIAEDMVNTGIFVSHQDENSMTTMEISEITERKPKPDDQSNSEKP